jgi:hypothetical protein
VVSGPADDAASMDGPGPYGPVEGSGLWYCADVGPSCGLLLRGDGDAAGMDGPGPTTPVEWSGLRCEGVGPSGGSLLRGDGHRVASVIGRE